MQYYTKSLCKINKKADCEYAIPCYSLIGGQDPTFLERDR